MKIKFEILNKKQKILLFHILLFFKKNDNLLFTKIILKFFEIPDRHLISKKILKRNKNNNFMGFKSIYLKFNCFSKEYNLSNKFFIIKKRNGIENYFNRILLIYKSKYFEFDNHLLTLKNLLLWIFKMRNILKQLIYLRVGSNQKTFLFEMIIQTKIKLNINFKGPRKILLKNLLDFEEKSMIFKRKIYKINNLGCQSFRFLKKNLKNHLLYNSFGHLHYINLYFLKNPKSFLTEIKSKTIPFFKKLIEAINKNKCQFCIILSKIWSFYHEILSKFNFQNLKKKFFKNFRINLINNYKEKRKNYFSVNNIVYIKLEILGKGGSSKVYKILRQDKKIFALKKNKFDIFGIQIIHNFVNEITILKLLTGKTKIIQVHDAEVNFKKKLFCIILELGECDLDLFFKKKKKFFNLLNIKWYWKQILEAVQEIHVERIVHGDLKPGNFLFIKNKLKLIDFGISKLIENDTTNITREIHVGTLNYMAPEAILEIPGIINKIPKFKTSRATDIWSLGCILFQFSQGHPPFKHFTMIQKIHAIVNNTLEIKYISCLNPLLTDVIRNCMKRNPDSRPTILELMGHSFLEFSP
jgi:serine/threonine-protein kinase TTK/MPS1